MASLKGIQIQGKMFMILVIILGLVFLTAMYLLLNQSFLTYLVSQVNSKVKLCETFEKNPLFGTIGCPKTTQEQLNDAGRALTGKS